MEQELNDGVVFGVLANILDSGLIRHGVRISVCIAANRRIARELTIQYRKCVLQAISVQRLLHRIFQKLSGKDAAIHMHELGEILCAIDELLRDAFCKLHDFLGFSVAENQGILAVTGTLTALIRDVVIIDDVSVVFIISKSSGYAWPMRNKRLLSEHHSPSRASEQRALPDYTWQKQQLPS